MGTELTEREISEFLARREDIRWLLQGLFAGYEIKKAERRARTSKDYDRNDLYIHFTDLFIIDFDRCSCKEGKEDVIEIYLKTRNDEIQTADSNRDIEDFRNYLYAGCLNTIEIYHPISERYHSLYPTRVHKYRGIQKKITEDNMLEVSVWDWKQIWNRKSEDFDTYDRTAPVYYRFYQYGGVCTEENEYQGRTVKILFADDETSQKDLIKNGPVLFHKLPVKDAEVTGYMGSPSNYTDGNPLFLIFAPFITPDRETPEPEEPGRELEKIKSGIFAAIEAFAKEHPDIAYKYIPMGDFLDVYKCADFQKSPRKGLNRNIFSKPGCPILRSGHIPVP